MTRLCCIAAILLLPVAALGAEPPAVAAVDGGAGDGGGSASDGGGGSTAPALSPSDQAALERALAADAAASKPAAAAAPQTPSPLVRAFQSLNPDISAIVDFAAGYYHGALVKSGDDPADTGANLQEVEVALSATVDPYFRADVYLTIPNATGLEVEEAVVTTTSLPGSLQLRAGVFRAPFGRQNTQHLHLQDFTRRPQLNALLLGTDGLRAPGLEVSWLVPTPFYLLVTAAAFSVGGADDVKQPLASFGGGERKDFTYLGNVKTFIPFTDTTSLFLGASFATGLTSKLAPSIAGDPFALAPERSYLYGADAYLKWKPPNESESYFGLAWTTEFLLRHLPASNLVEGALYSQLVLRVARRWYLGVRGEVDGLPSGPWVPRQYAGAASVTWALSEFSRVRVYGEGRYTPDAQLNAATGLVVEQGWSAAAFLQLEVAIGAHGAPRIDLNRISISPSNQGMSAMDRTIEVPA